MSVTVGIGLFPTEPFLKMVSLVKLSEDLGYSCAYLGDSQMIWREAYVILGAAAAVTNRIKLGTGVTNPVTRDLGVLAGSWATLREGIGDRFLLGIGTGDSALQTIGKKPATLASFERSIEVIRSLTEGRHVAYPETGADAHLTYVNSPAPIPVFPAVSSPKIHRLAGRIGDGAIVLVGIDPGFLKASRSELEVGAAEVGRDLKAHGFRVVCWTPCSIQIDGQAARRAVKAHVSRVLKRKLPFELDGPTMEIVEKIRNHYEYYEHMVAGTAHGDLVTDDLVERFAVAGTADEVHEQLKRLAATGLVDEIAIIPHTQDPTERDKIIRTVGEMIPDISGVKARVK